MAKKENAGDSKNITDTKHNTIKEKQTNNNNNSNNNDSNDNKEASKPEPPKDYIHVRARRGQATDSHSLAERVSKIFSFLLHKYYWDYFANKIRSSSLENNKICNRVCLNFLCFYMCRSEERKLVRE